MRSSASESLPAILVTLTRPPSLRTTEHHVEHCVSLASSFYADRKLYLAPGCRPPLLALWLLCVCWHRPFWQEAHDKEAVPSLHTGSKERDRNDFSLNSSVKDTPTVTLLFITRPHLLKVLPPSNCSTGWWRSLQFIALGCRTSYSALCLQSHS